MKGRGYQDEGAGLPAAGRRPHLQDQQSTLIPNIGRHTALIDIQDKVKSLDLNS